MNVVMTGRGLIVEVQGTAEETPFSKDQLNSMIALAEKGIQELIEREKREIKLME
jgi:ribonuclease PH